VPRTHTRRVRAGPAGRTGPGLARRAACLAGAVAAALAVTLAAGPAAQGQQAQGQQAQGQQAQGQQAQGQQARADGRVSVAIESVSPQWATPNHSVTVTGIVRNGTATAQQGLAVQLRSSAAPLGNRDDLGLYAAGAYPADYPVGTPVPLPAGVAPGGSAHWTVTLQPSAIGMNQFGVFPLAAQVLTIAGVPAATERTFLPFWPGAAASQGTARLSVGWVWPLIDQPNQAACPALLGTGLAGSVTAGGRLGGLLAAGRSYSAAAHLTWAIDPALVQNVKAMTHPYSVGGGALCGGATAEPASRAAGTWLSQLSAATSGQQVFLTPYADVDVAALSHDGLDEDLRSAFTEGRTVGQQDLHLPASSDTIAWPTDGLADAGVLGSLAINGISTVVLDSGVMPPSAQPPPSYTPSAQASAASGVGSSLHVLLADHTITQILGSAATGAGASFATGQRFLAETAMIVAESPSRARSIVVAPPRQWSPAPGLAASLLGETVHAPWLKPTSLAALAAVRHPSGQVARQAPPAHRANRHELSPAYLAQVKRLDEVIRQQASIFTPPDPGYLSAAIATLESSAWRRGRAQADLAQDLVRRVLAYVTAQGKKISIIDSGQITLGGSSGKVPISITNRLAQTVQVRLRATVPSLPGHPGDKGLTIGSFDNLVVVPAGKTMTIRMPVHAATVGVSDVSLALYSPDGRLLPGTQVELAVHATRFGTLALVIMCAALAVFVLASAARAIRRSRNEGDGGPGGPPHDNPVSDPPGPASVTGSVISGDDLAHHDPPEDPDEYADARGRASR
jgi:hypothetical protein